MTEVTVWIDGTYKNALSVDSIIVNYVGYGSKLKTLSGKPKELIRGKRLDGITLKFDNMSIGDYEFWYYLWYNSKQFNFYCMLPYVSLATSTPCFIELDGFGVEHAGGDTYAGTIKIGVE